MQLSSKYAKSAINGQGAVEMGMARFYHLLSSSKTFQSEPLNLPNVLELWQCSLLVHVVTLTGPSDHVCRIMQKIVLEVFGPTKTSFGTSSAKPSVYKILSRVTSLRAPNFGGVRI